MDKLRDKMDDLKKKLPGAMKDKVINKLKDKKKKLTDKAKGIGDRIDSLKAKTAK